MEFSDLVSISGKPGLFAIEGRRADGLICRALNEEKKRFMSSRSNIFSPLENITIYTLEDSITLKEAFQAIKEKAADVPLIKPKSSENELREFFKKIVPDYDDERVYASDIRKIIKWYSAIEQHDLMSVLDEKEEETEKEVATKEEEAEKPKKAAKKSKPKAKAEEKEEAAPAKEKKAVKKTQTSKKSKAKS